MQNPTLAERVAARNPDGSLRTVWLRRGDAEGDRNHCVELEDVGDVVDERLRLTRVDEADCGRVAGREDRRFCHSIEAGSRRAEAPIRDVSALPFRIVIVPILPLDAVLACNQLVHLADACTLDSSKLLDAAPLRRLLIEPKRVHLADNLETRCVVEGEARLPQEPVSPRAAGLARRVEPHSPIPDPHEETPHARR